MHYAPIALVLVLAGNVAFADDKPATSVEIGKLLKQMGFDPQPLSEEVWQVSIERDGWKVHVMVALTSDRDRIWLECKFAPIDDPAVVPASAWLRLLEENERVSPAHFAFDKSDKRVHLYKAFDNQNVNAVRLKKEIEAFDAIVRRTQALWRSENFAPLEALPIAPREKKDESSELAPQPREFQPVADIQGKWRIVRVERNGASTTEERFPVQPYLIVENETAEIRIEGQEARRVKLRLNAAAKPAQIDFIDRDGAERGIYQFERELLKICLGPIGGERPSQFTTRNNGGTWLLIMKKEE